MFNKDALANQVFDLTPYTVNQVEYLVQVHNAISFPWTEVTQGNISISKSKGIWRDDFILTMNGICYMTTTAPDLLDHRTIFEEAYGDVLLTGLGLGVGVLFADANPKINSVTVLEINKELISIIEPIITSACKRIFPKIIQADADNYNTNQRFDFAYCDHSDGKADNKNISRFSNRVIDWYSERTALEESWR